MAEQSAKTTPRKRRRWLRRLLAGFLIFLLLLIIFHRPIVHHGGRWVAIWVARKHNIALDLRIKGNIWSRLELHQVNARAAGTGPTPIESATVDHLAAEYDLIRLIKGDLGGLRLIEAGNIEATLTPVIEVKPEPPRPFTEKLRGLLSRPLPTPRVRVARADITNKDEKNPMVIRGLHVNVAPGANGVIGWERIQVGALDAFENVEGRTVMTGDEFSIAGLALWPELRVQLVRLQRPQAERPAELSLEAALPNGSVNAVVQLVEGGTLFDARANAELRDSAWLADRLNVDLPVPLEQVSARATWRGVPEEPRNSVGEVSFTAAGRKDAAYPGWGLSGSVALDRGTLKINPTELRAAESALTLDGTFDASRTLSHQGEGTAPLPEGTLQFRLSAPDLARAGAEFNQQARGQLQGAGTLGLRNNVATAEASYTGSNLALKDAELGSIVARIAATLPLNDNPPLPQLVADVSATVGPLRTHDITLDQARITARLADLRASIGELLITRGANEIRAQGTVKLTATGEIAEAPAVQLSIAAPALAEFGFRVGNEPLTGELRGSGNISVVNGKPDGTLQVTASNLQLGATRIASVQLETKAEGGGADVRLNLAHETNRVTATSRVVFDARGRIASLPPVQFEIDAPALAQFGLKAGDDAVAGAIRGSGSVSLVNGKLDGTVQATGEDLQFGATVIGGFRLDAKATQGVTDVTIDISREANHVTAKGRLVLNDKHQPTTPPSAEFVIDAPALQAFGLKVKDAPLAGVVRGTGQFTFENGEPTGALQLTATDLKIGTAKAGTLTVEASAANGRVDVKTLRAQFNANDRLEAAGSISLRAPNAYEGSLSLNVRDLSEFQPLLDALGQKKRIAGTLALEWSGTGDRQRHEGAGKLNARNARMDATFINEARVATNYALPERAEVPEFFIATDEMRGTGKLTWEQKRLHVSGLEIVVGGREVATGSISTPLDPFGRTVFPENVPIDARLEVKELDLARLYRDLNAKSPVEGTISATLTGRGTIADPTIELNLQGRSLRMPLPTDVKARSLTKEEQASYNVLRGDLDADVSFQNNRLSVDGTAKQADIRPLSFKAEMPLALKPILEGRPPDLENAPLEASVELPPSSLGFLSKLSPAIARAEGTIAISMRATGSINEPRLSGALTVDGRWIRAANPDYPPVSNFGVRITLAGNTATVERFGGHTGGGTFSVTGRVVAANLLQPTVDLRVRTDKVLAVRNDSVLVRVDSDVALRGPVNAGTASGRVVIAQSRFNKEIQILPMILPGRPKPVPREVSQPRVISFPNPPLRDWKFDIQIVTTAADPFLVRGNLAKGRVMVDMRLLGTGLEPYLVGSANLEQFTAQLPVSRLTTRRGSILFTQENPFEPRIEIESETVVRGYTIIARISGTATAPQLDLSSEPPLPQQEIVTLLTTGTLRGEAEAAGAALATRAGLMVLQEWYKKIFKRDFPLPQDEGGDNFFDRFSVDIGSVDQRTGQQEVTARFRISEKVIVVGDVEMGGGISGRVQYVFRFE